MEKLQADIDYCKAHKVRPFIFAEHTSTAADFLFHIGQFEAAERMLVDAVQVRTAHRPLAHAFCTRSGRLSLLQPCL